MKNKIKYCEDLLREYLSINDIVELTGLKPKKIEKIKSKLFLPF